MEKEGRQQIHLKLWHKDQQNNTCSILLSEIYLCQKYQYLIRLLLCYFRCSWKLQISNFFNSFYPSRHLASFFSTKETKTKNKLSIMEFTWKISECVQASKWLVLIGEWFLTNIKSIYSFHSNKLEHWVIKYDIFACSFSPSRLSRITCFSS